MTIKATVTVQVAENKDKAVVGLTFPAPFQLQYWRCRAPPHSQTHRHLESPGWSYWSSVWWRDPPQQIYTICTTDEKQKNTRLNVKHKLHCPVIASLEYMFDSPKWLRLYLLVGIRPGVVWTWQVTIRPRFLPTTVCKTNRVETMSICPFQVCLTCVSVFNFICMLSTFVFMAAVCLVC